MVGRASCLPNAKAYMPPLCKSQQILNRQARCLSYHFVSLSSEKDNNRIMHLGGPVEFPVLFEQLHRNFAEALESDEGKMPSFPGFPCLSVCSVGHNQGVLLIKACSFAVVINDSFHLAANRPPPGKGRIPCPNPDKNASRLCAPRPL